MVSAGGGDGLRGGGKREAGAQQVEEHGVGELGGPVGIVDEGTLGGQ